MIDKTSNGPAFPSANDVRIGQIGTAGHPGMTLRDYFAAKAMPALLQNALYNEITFDGFDSFDGMIAEQAYALADAMLAARSGT